MKKSLEFMGEGLGTVGKRLHAWRKSGFLRLTDVSKKIHVSQGSLSDLENDKALPSATTLTNICLYTDLSLCWLLTGKGPVKRITDETNGKGEISEDLTLLLQDPQLKEMIDTLIRIYRSAEPEKIAHLSGFLAGSDPGKA